MLLIESRCGSWLAPHSFALVKRLCLNAGRHAASFFKTPPVVRVEMRLLAVKPAELISGISLWCSDIPQWLSSSIERRWVQPTRRTAFLSEKPISAFCARVNALNGDEAAGPLPWQNCLSQRTSRNSSPASFGWMKTKPKRHKHKPWDGYLIWNGKKKAGAETLLSVTVYWPWTSWKKDIFTPWIILLPVSFL